MMRELCWNITTKCNQNCGYCLRFMNIPDQTKDNNLQILNNLSECGVNKLTWGGGEPMMYPYIKDMLKTAHDFGIQNHLVSNGVLLNDNRIDEIASYLDTLTLSLDSVHSATNNVIGRGSNHFNNVASIIQHIKYKQYPIKLKINTVACYYNKDEFGDLLNFVDKNVNFWRIFKMMPIRERAVANYQRFQITQQCFDEIKAFLQQNAKNTQLSFRESTDMEQKYFLLVANGDIFCTEHGKDIRKGSALDVRTLSNELQNQGR